MKEKSAILITPKRISSFIEDLKVLLDLGYDAAFKLTQQDGADGIKRQFLEIIGSCGKADNVFKTNIEITTIFSTNLYPDVLDTKEIEFPLDPTTCQMTFSKFAQRLNILSDEVASITFASGDSQ